MIVLQLEVPSRDCIDDQRGSGWPDRDGNVDPRPCLQSTEKGLTPIVYTHRIGKIGLEILSRGIPVTDDIMTINGQIDVVHGHHTLPTVIAAMRFPEKPAIFVCHDFKAWHDFPPDLPSIRNFVALGRTSRSRLTYLAGVSPEKIVTIANGVDTERFRPGPLLPPQPARAVAFCRELEFATAIREACRRRGLVVDVVGAAVGLEQQPERVLPQYDLVFASGRTAQEALVCERAVILCDERGLAGLMTQDLFDSWGQNLGLASLQKPVTVESMTAEIDRYDSTACRAFAMNTNDKRTMDRCADKYIKLYNKVVEEHANAQPVSDLNRYYCKLLQSYSPHLKEFWPWLIENGW